MDSAAAADSRQHRIAVLAGDGVGKEVIPEGLRVIDKVRPGMCNWELLPWGAEFYERTGRMMPIEALDVLQQFDAIYLGACGWPTIPDDVSLWGLLLPIRQRFRQYINLRPVRGLPGIRTPLSALQPDKLDMLFVRENTEGEYTGAGGRVHAGLPDELAVEVPVFTRAAIERCVAYGFQRARERRRHLTSVTKSNASRYAYVLWDQIVEELRQQTYPDVTVERVHVDAMAARMLLRPAAIDVVVASNLFGDILTDLGGALQGSLGVAASANLNPEREYPSLFEPVHGSAPDIAGRGVANPIGAIWAGALMLRHLGEDEAAQRVEDAIATVTSAGAPLTADLGGSASTSEVGTAIAEAAAQPARATARSG